ncbi:chromate transporter, partial [Bordetella pertussis]|uniref:chromate transporter n=1 Tax=Bordetella pertussis TaxID=520 RepID=UPI000AFDA960
ALAAPAGTALAVGVGRRTGLCALLLFALGALLPAPLGGWPGALACTALIFLPGALLLVGALPFWNVLRGRPAVRAALAGVNA